MRGDKKGREVIWYKVECEEGRPGIALGGLESKGETQSRQIGKLAGTNAWNCGSRTRYPFVRSEIVKTNLN